MSNTKGGAAPVDVGAARGTAETAAATVDDPRAAARAQVDLKVEAEENEKLGVDVSAPKPDKK